MNKFFLAFAALAFGVSDMADVNYRPYISTNLAKAVITTTDDVDDVVEEKCDGSGWITHGDGHKTPCPGCSECANNTPDPIPEPDIKVACQCGCNQMGCECQSNNKAVKKKNVLTCETKQRGPIMRLLFGK